MSAPSFVKVGVSSTGETIEEADLGTITRIEFDLEFQQKKTKGAFGGLRDRLQPADPDLMAVAFQGTMPVDYVEPKGHTEIFEGTVRNLGDARGSGVETVVIDVSRLAARNRDITGFAVAASCPDGFGRVAGIVCHVYDTSVEGARTHITACRFDVTRPNITSGLFGSLVRSGDGWAFRKVTEYGTGRGWEDVARSARAHMTP